MDLLEKKEEVEVLEDENDMDFSIPLNDGESEQQMFEPKSDSDEELPTISVTPVPPKKKKLEKIKWKKKQLHTEDYTWKYQTQSNKVFEFNIPYHMFKQYIPDEIMQLFA